MRNAIVTTWNLSGNTIKESKINFWACKNEKDIEGICISMNSPETNPTRKGHGREIFISLKDLKKELKKETKI